MSNPTAATAPGVRNADLENPTALPPLGMSKEIGELVSAICATMGELAPIAKTPAKSGGGGLQYEYLSEDAITATLRPLLSKHGLCIFPRGFQVVEREDYEAGKSQMTRLYTRQRFIIAHKSGQWMECETTGEASDSGDKGGNKCMTAAYKYMERQTFAINGGSDPDERHSDDVARTGRGYGNRATQQQQNTNQQQTRAPQQNTGNQQRSNPNTAAAGGQQANPNYPGGVGDDARAGSLIAIIDKASSHAEVMGLIEKAKKVQWSDAQKARIRNSAAARRVSFWSAALDAAPDLETVDAIAGDAAPALNAFPELGKIVFVRANQRRTAITASQEVANAPTPGPDGLDNGDTMPYSDTPVTPFDF